MKHYDLGMTSRYESEM